MDKNYKNFCDKVGDTDVWFYVMVSEADDSYVVELMRLAQLETISLLKSVSRQIFFHDKTTVEGEKRQEKIMELLDKCEEIVMEGKNDTL